MHARLQEFICRNGPSAWGDAPSCSGVVAEVLWPARRLISAAVVAGHEIECLFRLKQPHPGVFVKVRKGHELEAKVFVIETGSERVCFSGCTVRVSEAVL